MKQIKHSSDSQQIMLDLFLSHQKVTIIERRDQFILKRLFKCYFDQELCAEIKNWFNFSFSKSLRGLPLLHSTSLLSTSSLPCFKKSFLSRAGTLWNNFRRFTTSQHLNAEEISHELAPQLVMDWFYKLRNDNYYYY